MRRPINNEKSRITTFSRRSKNLCKKASELSILCGVDVCMIIFGHNKGGNPEIWPPDPSEFARIFSKYTNGNSWKRNYNASDAFVAKKNDIYIVQGQKSEPKDKVKNSTCNVNFEHLSEGQVRELVGKLDNKLAAVRTKINKMKENQLAMAEKDESQLTQELSNFQRQDYFEEINNNLDFIFDYGDDDQQPNSLDLLPLDELDWEPIDPIFEDVTPFEEMVDEDDFSQLTGLFNFC